MPNQNQNKISLPVIKRLPRYFRLVHELKDRGINTVSSSELAALLGTTASQVRQDFNCFGGFGQQGVGYNVDLLFRELEKLLYSGRELDTILVGTGRLGRTISGFLASEATGFRLVAAFDNAPGEIGRALGQLTVLDVATLQDFCKKHKPQVAVLCIPEQSAAELAPTLLQLGIKGFWNFSNYDLAADSPGVTVENVHLGDSISSLGFQVRNAEAPRA
ncbi:redox-sensing transcriptional repressor Rex [Ruminococcaceae bacterium OttesenSCG-928-O06]|nr:redox-sensing transcriptional repressor Rex [Ruminococcaceae bacterium OttesenSCG-928-O06]